MQVVKFSDSQGFPLDLAAGYIVFHKIQHTLVCWAYKYCEMPNSFKTHNLNSLGKFLFSLRESWQANEVESVPWVVPLEDAKSLLS